MKKSLCLLFFSIVLLSLQSCNEKKNKADLLREKIVNNNKGGQGVLQNWGENIILPAYENYQKEVSLFLEDTRNFEKNRTAENFEKLKQSWLTAYKAFQKAMIFNFSFAGNVYFAEMANTFPTYPKQTEGNTEGLIAIEDNIMLLLDDEKEQITLEPTYAVAQRVYQGFPALDYLLFEKTHTLDFYQTTKGAASAKYMVLLVEFLKKNIDYVLSRWQMNLQSYITDDDVSSNGSYANTINAFIQSYEKSIRSDKVAYAAGAINIQGGKPEPTIIEGYYNGQVDKELLIVALKSSQDFFNGKAFSSEKKGRSIYDLLVEFDNKRLADNINKQYEIIFQTIQAMPNSLKQTAASDTKKMEELYMALQRNVAYFKIDMLATLNVQLGYQDTDGD